MVHLVTALLPSAVLRLILPSSEPARWVARPLLLDALRVAALLTLVPLSPCSWEVLVALRLVPSVVFSMLLLEVQVAVPPVVLPQVRRHQREPPRVVSPLPLALELPLVCPPPPTMAPSP
jgi:hypothetical protein